VLLSVVPSFDRYIERVRLFDLIGVGEKAILWLQDELIDSTAQTRELDGNRKGAGGERFATLISIRSELRRHPLFEYLDLNSERTISQHPSTVRAALELLLMLCFVSMLPRVPIRRALTSCTDQEKCTREERYERSMRFNIKRERWASIVFFRGCIRSTVRPIHL
jgi:hypothetical protein